MSHLVTITDKIFVAPAVVLSIESCLGGCVLIIKNGRDIFVSGMTPEEVSDKISAKIS